MSDNSKHSKRANPKGDNLTEKQEKFCRAYIDTDGNGAEAYRMSYNCANMKPNTIYVEAHKLLKDHKIALRIDEIRAERAEASKVDRTKVEQVLMDIVTADVNDLYSIDPVSGKIKLKSPNQLPKKARNALKKIKNNRGVVEYEFNGKVEAARLIGSWNGWDAPKELNVNSKNIMGGEIRIGYNDDEE